MNKMVRNLVKVAAICAASVLVLASCSKRDINASRQVEMEERYRRASAEIENSAPRSSSQSAVEGQEVVAPVSADVNASTTPSAQTESVNPTKTAKKGFVQRAVEKTVVKKVERFVSKHPELKQQYEKTQSLDPNLKMAIILAIVAIIIGLFAYISWIFGLISLIFLIVALYFLILWVLTL